MEFRGVLGAAIGMWSSWDTIHSGATLSCRCATLVYARVKESSEAWPSRRPNKRKKNLGRGKDKRACGKGPEGADNAPPPQIESP